MTSPSHPLADADTYRAIFFEETHDHLATVESILLRLKPEQACQDDLNAIFRAVHSIKGSAAMLGCDDMAALAHLQENLLDVLRKHERPIEPGDVQAMLEAGDVLRAQALRHRGVAAHVPDASAVQSLLRERLDCPRTGAGGTAGPVTRQFAVRLGPLAEAIAQADLDMLLEGLAQMGSVTGTQVDNVAGGSVRFEVALEGTATDLQAVLSLIVAPELITIEAAGSPAAPSAAELAAAPPVPVPAASSLNADLGDELFVDPQEFRARRQAAAPAARPAAEAPEPSTVATDTGSIRVATEKVDLLVNLIGELVITEAMLARASTGESGNPLLDRGLADLARHTRDLQHAVMAIRMLPLSNVFSRFPRLVHELSGRLGKRVEFTVAGEATELDRGLIEKISDPLTHLVRNAIDHGLETPQEREAVGKPPSGTLRLQATQRGGNVVIEVSDDGRGLDRERILQQAVLQGLAIAPDASDDEVWELIFAPGFSTAREVTDLSGRGVGMDVVRRNIQALSGGVELASAPGWGTTVTVSVPLTLAIIDAMTVAVGDAVYVLPLSGVVESLPLDPRNLHALRDHGEALAVHGEYLPVVHLARLFPPQRGGTERGGIVVVLEADGRRAALVVDALVGQQQVVVKSLEANFRKIAGLSSATVMSDGSVALILDVNHLVRAGAATPAWRGTPSTEKKP
jgi:two-component system chemotaxis sensor kinase CheA